MGKTTPEQRREAVRRIAAGEATATTVAKAHGVSLSAVCKWVSRPGEKLYRLPRPAFSTATLVGAYESGMSLKEVAALYGVPFSTVRVRLKAAGVAMATKTRRRRRHRLDAVALVADYRAGMTVHQLAAREGVSAQTVSLVLREAGEPLRPSGQRRGHKTGPRKNPKPQPSRYDWPAVDWTRRDADIARQLRCSREAVRQQRRKWAAAGHPPPPLTPPPAAGSTPPPPPPAA